MANGHAVSGCLPAWAVNDPSETCVPLDELYDRLFDVNHASVFDGQRVDVFAPGGPSDEPEEQVILRGSIDRNPFAEEPDPRVPVVNVEVVTGHWRPHLDPAGVADAAAKPRARTGSNTRCCPQ